MAAPLLPIAVVGDSWGDLSVERIELALGVDVHDTYAVSGQSTLVFHPLRYEAAQKIFEDQGVSSIYMQLGGIDELLWTISGNDPNSLYKPENTAKLLRDIARAFTQHGHYVFHASYQTVDAGGNFNGIPTSWAPFITDDFGADRYTYIDSNHLDLTYADPLHLNSAGYDAKIALVDWAVERDFE